MNKIPITSMSAKIFKFKITQNYTNIRKLNYKLNFRFFQGYRELYYRILKTQVVIFL